MMKKIILLGCCLIFSLLMPTKAFGGYQPTSAMMSSVSGLGSGNNVWRTAHSKVNSYYSSSTTYEHNAYEESYSGPKQFGSTSRLAQLAVTADQYAVDNNLGLVSKNMLLGIVPIEPPTGVDDEESPIGDGIILLLICGVGYAIYRKKRGALNVN